MTRKKRKPSPEFVAREARRKERNAQVMAGVWAKMQELRPPPTCPDCPHAWNEHILPGIFGNYHEDVDLPENKGRVLDPNDYVGCLASGQVGCSCRRQNEQAEWDEQAAMLGFHELMAE